MLARTITKTDYALLPPFCSGKVWFSAVYVYAYYNKWLKTLILQIMHCYYVAISWTQILTLLSPTGVESFLGRLRWQLGTRRQLLVYHHMITRTYQLTSITMSQIAPCRCREICRWSFPVRLSSTLLIVHLYIIICIITYDYKQSTHYCPLLVWSSLSRRCRTFLRCLVFVCRTFLEESEEVIGVPWLTLDV